MKEKEQKIKGRRRLPTFASIVSRNSKFISDIASNDRVNLVKIGRPEPDIQDEG